MEEKTTSRIIKKYPNRRLYDTAISRYVTLEHIKTLVKEQVIFCVQEAKTGEDITRNILLQIILEQEEINEQPIFSSEVLAQLIRFYDNTLQGMMANYFERSLTMFAKQQEELHDNQYNPFTLMTEMAEQNIKLWREMQESFFDTLQANKSSKNKK